MVANMSLCALPTLLSRKSCLKGATRLLLHQESHLRWHMIPRGSTRCQQVMQSLQSKPRSCRTLLLDSELIPLLLSPGTRNLNFPIATPTREPMTATRKGRAWQRRAMSHRTLFLKMRSWRLTGRRQPIPLLPILILPRGLRGVLLTTAWKWRTQLRALNREARSRPLQPSD